MDLIEDVSRASQHLTNEILVSNTGYDKSDMDNSQQLYSNAMVGDND